MNKSKLEVNLARQLGITVADIHDLLLRWNTGGKIEPIEGQVLGQYVALTLRSSGDFAPAQIERAVSAWLNLARDSKRPEFTASFICVQRKSQETSPSADPIDCLDKLKCGMQLSTSDFDRLCSWGYLALKQWEKRDDDSCSAAYQRWQDLLIERCFPFSHAPVYFPKQYLRKILKMSKQHDNQMIPTDPSKLATIAIVESEMHIDQPNQELLFKPIFASALRRLFEYVGSQSWSQFRGENHRRCRVMIERAIETYSGKVSRLGIVTLHALNVVDNFAGSPVRAIANELNRESLWPVCPGTLVRPLRLLRTHFKRCLREKVIDAGLRELFGIGPVALLWSHSAGRLTGFVTQTTAQAKVSITAIAAASCVIGGWYWVDHIFPEFTQTGIPKGTSLLPMPVGRPETDSKKGQTSGETVKVGARTLVQVKPFPKFVGSGRNAERSGTVRGRFERTW